MIDTSTIIFNFLKINLETSVIHFTKRKEILIIIKTGHSNKFVLMKKKRKKEKFFQLLVQNNFSKIAPIIKFDHVSIMQRKFLLFSLNQRFNKRNLDVEAKHEKLIEMIEFLMVPLSYHHSQSFSFPTTLYDIASRSAYFYTIT